ncbi:hypothetical protein D3C73_1665020 [compost metagenome]
MPGDADEQRTQLLVISRIDNEACGIAVLRNGAALPVQEPLKHGLFAGVQLAGILKEAVRDP